MIGRICEIYYYYYYYYYYYHVRPEILFKMFL